MVARLATLCPAGVGVVQGIGDDAAIVRLPEDTARDLVLTSDAVIEGVHFVAGTPPDRVGHKAVARALSDLAAMGAQPAWVLLNLVSPRGPMAAELDLLFGAAAACAAAAGASIVGGDTARGSALALHAFAAGHLPRGSGLLRAGARPGDVLCVTGTLGGSLAGHHLDFVPRVREGLWLRQDGRARAAIDITDGLALDLWRMLETDGLGARLDLRALPLSVAARQANDGRPAIEHALYDGEDYELLFALAPQDLPAFSQAWSAAFPGTSCTPIGVCLPPPLRLCATGPEGEVELAPHGYEHF